MAYTQEGECRNTGKTHFKKGSIPYNKGIIIENPSRRSTTYYRRLILEVSNNPACVKCGESKKKLLVHHKDRNYLNNDLSNIEILCYSCHSKEHQTSKNFKYHGYEAVLVGKQRKGDL